MLRCEFNQVKRVELTRSGKVPDTVKHAYLRKPVPFEALNIERLVDDICTIFKIKRKYINVVPALKGHYEITLTTITKQNYGVVNEWPTYQKRFTERGHMVYLNTFIVVTK